MIAPSIKLLSGKKQNPPALDFHIIPTITLGRSGDKQKWGYKRLLAFEWGYWAIVLIFKIK